MDSNEQLVEIEQALAHDPIFGESTLIRQRVFRLYDFALEALANQLP